MDIIKKIKNYTINERHCLGEGAFGKVYQAISDQGRKVAIKRVEQKLICSDKYLKQSLNNEIVIMQKLKHPNIVQLYEVIYTQNNIYLIMQYCSGGDLKRYMMTKKINQEIAFNIIRQIVKGFQELNKFGIIHRDLKAANILVHQQNFKICDFGFAKFFGEAGKMARTCVGTPIYMSPQVLKHKHYTSKTDVWSLGVLFFELLFGRTPFSGYNEDDLYRNIMKGSLTIPECSKEAAKILQGTLVIEEEKRWGWNQCVQALFNRPVGIQRVRGNTPKQGIFYKQQRDPSGDNLDKRVYDNQIINNPIKPPANNNYFPDDNPDLQSPHEKVKHEIHKKLPKNKLAVQNEEEQARAHGQIQVIQAPVIQKHRQGNPRFIYFVLIELITNPLEGSQRFWHFLKSLWKEAKQLYAESLQKQSSTILKSVIQCDRMALQKLQDEIKTKINEKQQKYSRQKEDKQQENPRKLGEIVFQETKAYAANQKNLIWLKRYLDKKYLQEPLQ